jgi:hypothetical protein
MTLAWWAGCVMPGPVGPHPPAFEPPPPPEIAEFSVKCKTDGDKWVLDVSATAWTGGGALLMSEDGVYVEAHPVLVETTTVDGSGETLALDLAIVSDWRTQNNGSSTVFTCGDAPALAFTLYDLAGDPAACVWMDDPSADPKYECL